MTTSKKANMEAKLSSVCGFPVELTIRGLNQFTFSAEGRRNFSRAVKFLSLSGKVVSVDTDYDAECDQTCCYLTVAE
jgi:hypothetical protein